MAESFSETSQTIQKDHAHKCTGEYIYKNIRFNSDISLPILQRVENFKFLESDIIIDSFPRTGTTFTQEIIWQILNAELVEKKSGISPDKTATFGTTHSRFPYLELNTLPSKRDNDLPIDIIEKQRSEDEICNRKYGRLIKTHLPLFFIHGPLLIAKPKIILVFRNPCDTCVSYYNFHKGMPSFNWPGNFDEFFEIFHGGQTVYGSYFDWYRDWFAEAALDQQNGANKWPIGEGKLIRQSKSGFSLMLLRYEDLINRPHLNIKVLAKFLDVDLTDQQCDIIARNTSFKTMSSDHENNFFIESTGFRFFRKGQIGNWKEWMKKEQYDTLRGKMEKEIGQFQVEFEYE